MIAGRARPRRWRQVEKGMTLADALSADPRVSSRVDRATIDRLTSPRNYLGLAPEMVDRVLASVRR
jgi:3-carboxy-cis,cis-muconate cycloisomerase